MRLQIREIVEMNECIADHAREVTVANVRIRVIKKALPENVRRHCSTSVSSNGLAIVALLFTALPKYRWLRRLLSRWGEAAWRTSVTARGSTSGLAGMAHSW